MKPNARTAAAVALSVLAAALGLLPAPAAAGPAPGMYHPVAPVRVLDTRYGIGGVGRLAPGQQIDFALPALGGQAASGFSAVILNVTAVAPSAVGYLTVWPSGTPRPTASNLNWLAGENIANQVVTGVSAGHIGIYNNNSFTDLVIDAEGWFGPDDASGAGQMRPLMPARILDTRIGLGAPAAPLGQGAMLALQVAGRGNVPASGVGAVVLNLTETQATQASYLSIFPGTAAPTTSNLNFRAGHDQAVRAVVQLASDGTVTIYNSLGTVHVIVDVGGYFTSAPDGGTGGFFVPITPTRVLDTRSGAPPGPGQSLHVPVGVPAGSSAAFVNLTATDTSGGSFLVGYPSGNARVLSSDVNFGPSEVVANLGAYKLGADGAITIYNSAAPVNVIADVDGYFTAAPVAGSPPGATAPAAATIHDRGASLSWSPPAATGGSQIISYTVTMGDGSTYVTPAGQTSLDLAGLTNTQTYTATVIALNAVGSGPASSPPTSFTPLGTPDPPVAVVAVAGVQSATISWQPPANNGGAPILNYEVTVSPEGGLIGVAGTSVTWGGLPPSGHVFYVRAVNAYGRGPWAGSNLVVPTSINQHKIVVSLSLQHMWVYEGSVLVMETDVTTGRPALPTPPGDYHIFYKTSPYEMISPWPYGSPYYYPPTWVNWVLEFIPGGYFLHDAPWRSWFGPGSDIYDGTHGCVNIPNGPMQWLYGWANVGDEVVVQN